MLHKCSVTCIKAHTASLGMVPQKPNSVRSSRRSAGAKRRMFILMLTPRLRVERKKEGDLSVKRVEVACGVDSLSRVSTLI